jgi:Sap-like sulfolipid-1-addressing protein
VDKVVLYAFTAALNPTLVTATTVMLLLPNPLRLMLGYWLGAMFVSVTLGILIVFSLHDSSAVSTTKNTLSPIADIVLGALALVLALALATGRDKGMTERRAERREGKDPPRWQRTLSKGTARTTFVIGVLLTLPGASYLLGLHNIDQLNYSPEVTVLVIIGFNLIMLILLEAPLLAFAIAPEATPKAVDRAKAWAGARWRTVAVLGLCVIGGALVLKGVVGLA